MSRIAVVTSSPPFIEGGHLVIARALVRALCECGHDAGLVVTPQNRFGRLASAYVATWLTDVGVAYDDRRVDQVISLRYPSYAVRHDVHVCWLNHRMREYYDLWDRFYSTLPRRSRPKEQARRRIVHVVDNYLLRRNVTRLVAQSKTIQTRLQRWGGLRADVVYPPAPQRQYRCDEYGEYLFVVSRLTALKRVALVVEALARPEAAGVRCVIAGDGEEREKVTNAIAAHGLADRVRLLGRIDETELVDHLARCRAVVFTPYQEDYGFVTVEAFSSRKAVITCNDSGGPAELVEHDRNGFVCSASPMELAAAFGRIMGDGAVAARLGEAGQARAAELTWERTVEQLVLV